MCANASVAVALETAVEKLRLAVEKESKFASF